MRVHVGGTFFERPLGPEFKNNCTSPPAPVVWDIQTVAIQSLFINSEVVWLANISLGGGRYSSMPPVNSVAACVVTVKYSHTFTKVRPVMLC